MPVRWLRRPSIVSESPPSMKQPTEAINVSGSSLSPRNLPRNLSPRNRCPRGTEELPRVAYRPFV